MSINIVDLVKNYVSQDLIAKAGSFLNESEGNVSNAVSGIIPTLLGSVATKATESEQGAADVLESAKGFFNSGILNNTSSLFGNADLLSKGTSLFKGLLGDKASAVIDTISNFAGVKSSSSGSLISMIVPLIMGLLGKQATDNNMSAGSFSGFLGAQKNNILNALPSGLGSIGSLLGFNAISDNVNQTVSNVKEGAAATYNYAEESAERAAGGGAKWLLPLLLVAVAALALWYFLGKGCNNAGIEGGDTTVTTPPDTSTALIAPPVTNFPVTGTYDSVSGNYIYEVGENREIKLEDGTTLTVGANSTEAKLFDFLTNGTVDTADKSKGWITLDRVYFETGKSVLTQQSQQQLTNIAAILKNFATAKVKFGGYTDNTGPADGNVKLSAERAKIAADALIKAGAAAANVSSEGYGPEHPVCPANDTPECKAQNRRVDIRVTAK